MMNLIKRIIPVLLLGLSAPMLAVANPAGGNNNSSFSFSFSSGYAAPHARYAYRDSYRPHARAYSPHYQPPAHVNTTYVEKRIYNYSENRGRHGVRKEYREHRGNYRRGHGGYYGRPGHNSYARNGHY